MTDELKETGCEEYQALARRDFLTMASGIGIAAFVPTWLPQVVMAQSSNSTRDIVVSIFLNGGTDGMSMVVPFGDPDYYTGRPTIAVPRPDAAVGTANRATNLDGFFGFSPGMAPLYPARKLFGEQSRVATLTCSVATSLSLLTRPTRPGVRSRASTAQATCNATTA